MTDLQTYLLVAPLVLIVLAAVGYWWISRTDAHGQAPGEP